jgi:hypothetical protein
MAAKRQTYSIKKRAPQRLFAPIMKVPQKQSSRCHHTACRLARAAVSFAVAGLFFGSSHGTPASPAAQEPQGEIIGTVEGQAIAVKGPMSVQVVGNEVKTLLRSGADIHVKSGRARITLTDGSTIAVCGPAHISMLKSGNALTIALDTGTIHARVAGNLTLNIFTAQIVAKTVAIGDGPQDFLVGFDAPGLMCVRAGLGALRLEEQFGGATVIVPQGGDVTLAGGQLQNLHNNTGLCACEAFDAAAAPSSGIGPEISALASSEDIRKDSAPRKPAAQMTAIPKAPGLAKVPAVEPSYQVFMPPLRYDANAKIQDEVDPRLIVLVRRVRVRPTLIFQSRVEGDPLPAAQNQLSAVKTKPQEQSAAKPAQAASSSVVDRLKTFFKSLWTPSS